MLLLVLLGLELATNHWFMGLYVLDVYATGSGNPLILGLGGFLGTLFCLTVGGLFGAVWVTQAALPLMRAQGSGRILQVSSVGGVAAFPNTGAYHASKWALEGFSDSLSQELAGTGVFVTIIEPGAYGTDWSGSSARRASIHSDVSTSGGRSGSTMRQADGWPARANAPTR